jgi:hypothetical protein
MEKTYAVLASGGPVEFVTGKLNELRFRQTELTQRLDAKAAEQQELSSRESRYHRSKEEIGQLVARLQSPASEELFKLRAQIASQLKVLVETLFIGSIGDRPRTERAIEYLKATAADDAGDVIAHMEQKAAQPEQARRYFAVGFRDSNVRIVFPADYDPLRYEQQIVTKAGSIDLIQAENRDEGRGSEGLLDPRNQGS